MELAAHLIVPILLIAAALIGISTAREDIQTSIAQSIDSTAISSQEDLVAFVDQARDFARAGGKEEAMKAFKDRQGDFVLGDQYIYAYDFQGATLVHPISPQFLGKSRIDNQDPYGVKFILDRRDLA